MTEDERLESLLREALPATTERAPSRDLWPLIVSRGRGPARWSWLDLGIAAAVAIALLMRPEWLWLMAYHL